MESLRLCTGSYLAGLLLVLGSLASGSALGSSVNLPECSPETCTWSISVDGNEMMSGMYMADAEGNIILNEPVSGGGDGFTFSLDSMNGNIDPLLGFGLGATNTSGSAKTFAFAFSLPLGGLTGDVATYAELGTTLSAYTEAGGSVFPTLGGGKVVDSQDIKFSPTDSIDKGVDVGAGLSQTGQGTATNIETASGLISLIGGYDLMTVTVAFGLTDQTGVGFSGFVQQTLSPGEIPVPAAVWLFGSGLLGLLGVARRRN